MGHPPLHCCSTFPFSCGRTDALGKDKQEGPAVKPLLFPGVDSHNSCPGSAQEPSGRQNNLKLKHPLTSLAAEQQEKPGGFAV